MMNWTVPFKKKQLSTNIQCIAAISPYPHEPSTQCFFHLPPRVTEMVRTLREMCVGLVARNLWCVESLCGFPSLVGQELWTAYVQGGSGHLNNIKSAVGEVNITLQACFSFLDIKGRLMQRRALL